MFVGQPHFPFLNRFDMGWGYKVYNCLAIRKQNAFFFIQKVKFVVSWDEKCCLFT